MGSACESYFGDAGKCGKYCANRGRNFNAFLKPAIFAVQITVMWHEKKSLFAQLLRLYILRVCANIGCVDGRKAQLK
jgi:hypothetical protein